MTIPKAISTLRDKTSQREFAERLETTVETISRWENGRREPTREALTKLAELAKSSGRNDLFEFFEARRAASVAATIKNLPSAGTQRRVPVADLERWQRMAQVIRDQVHEARAGYMKIAPSPIHRQMWGIEDDLIPQLMESIEMYINPKRKEKRSAKTK